MKQLQWSRKVLQRTARKKCTALFLALCITVFVTAVVPTASYAAVPGQVILISPSINATDVSTAPTLVWDLLSKR